ncbi:MAG: LamG-like jellyroll fold domain-containing protein [Verrucomicrobiia bacterium]
MMSYPSLCESGTGSHVGQEGSRLPWRRARFASSLAVAVVLCAAPASALATDRVFRAGVYAVDVTPTDFPVIVNGGFLAASTSKANDPLHARCLVLDDGETRIGLCVLDTCLIPRELADEAKRLIQEATGLQPDRVMISATHTHSAPSLMQALGTPVDPQYPAFLLPRLVEGFRRAINQLAPARIGWTTTSAPDHTHTRVWIRRSDRVEANPFGERAVRANMHPGHVNPDVIGPSGPSDPELSLVSIQSPSGQPIALLANYAMHYFGAAPLSADYYGRFAEKLRALFKAGESDPPFVGIMSQGFSGDQHWMDYGKPARSVSIDEYASALAEMVHDASSQIDYQDWVPIKMLEREIPLAVRMPNSERLAWARQVADGMKGRLPKTIPEVYAAEQLWLEANPVRNVKLQALSLGDLGVTMTPCEVFAITSLKLKAQSPFRPLINIELANGEEGYIPPPEHHPLGSYNTWACRTAGLEVQAEPKVVDALLGMLEDLSGKPRRPVTDPHGAYAQSILKAEPAAYWRMNDFGGPHALDATRHRRPATFEDGVAFYLDGPCSPVFSGARTVNRAVHFAGGRMAAAIPLPPGQYSVEMLVWNGLPSRVRGETGHLFAWGDQLRIQGTNGTPGRLALVAGPEHACLTGMMEMPVKTWSHLVFTRDGEEVTVYLNGKPEIMGTAPLFDPGAVNTLFVGGREDHVDTFEGKLDEVAVYDRPLGAAEVLRHYREADLGASVKRIARVAPDPSGPQCAAVLQSRPMAYWRLGENGYDGPRAFDASGNGIHGTYEEWVELYQAGVDSPGFTGGKGTNHAPRFNGSRMRATPTGLGPAYSVSFWFWNNRPNDQSPVTAYLFSRGPDGASQAPGDHLGIGGTHLFQAGRLFFFNGNELNQVLSGKAVIPPRSWNHVLLIRDGSKVRAYLNGQLEPEIDGAVEVSPGARVEEIFFGGRNDSFANLDGRLDETVLYNRALTAQEARTLFDRSAEPDR